MTTKGVYETDGSLRVTVAGGSLTTGAVTLASGAVASGAFASGSVASGAVASGAIASGAYAAGSIGASAFAAGASAFNDENDQPVTIWADYYPGDDVVDWIGEDVYNGVKIKSFQTFPGFVNFYNQVAPLGKPLAITETGALCDSGVPCPGSKWIYSTHHNLKDFPAVQAWFWWSSMGQSGRDFRLQGADINEFISIGGSTYFRRMTP